MTAAVMYAQGLPTPYVDSKPFRIEEVDLEGPGEGEILVEILGAGLCHSDLSAVAGLRTRKVPVVGGHEGAGIVREIGPGVKRLKPGDHVVMTNITACGHCRPCLESRPVLCEGVIEPAVQGTLANGARKLVGHTGRLYHYSGVSSFAQYAVTLPNAVIKIDPAVPLDVAAMFGCAVITGAGCVFNAAKLRPGQSAAVLGLGGVGLNTVMAAKIAGATKIIGIDLVESKLPLARELGCTHTFSARDPNLAEAVKDITGGGVDFSFEISGSPAAMATANAITRKGGEIVGVGLCGPNDLYQYAHASLVLEEKVFRGSFMGSCVPERDIPRYAEMYLDGRLPVHKLKSNAIDFAGLNLSLDLLDRGEVVRQILLPHG